MKTFLIALMLALTAAPAFATDTPLAKVMQGMGERLEAVAKRAGDQSRNADSAKLSEELSGLVRDALGLGPSTITDLPAADQPKARIEYRRLLGQLFLRALDLEAAFREGRNAATGPIIQDLGSIRKQG